MFSLGSGIMRTPRPSLSNSGNSSSMIGKRASDALAEGKGGGVMGGGDGDDDGDDDGRGGDVDDVGGEMGVVGGVSCRLIP